MFWRRSRQQGTGDAVPEYGGVRGKFYLWRCSKTLMFQSENLPGVNPSDRPEASKNLCSSAGSSTSTWTAIPLELEILVISKQSHDSIPGTLFAWIKNVHQKISHFILFHVFEYKTKLRHRFLAVMIDSKRFLRVLQQFSVSRFCFKVFVFD